MNKELRDLLAQLDAKEKEMTKLKEAGEIRSAHALLDDIKELEMKIDIAKQNEKRELEGAKKVVKKEGKDKEDRSLDLESLEYRQAFIEYLAGDKDAFEKRAINGIGGANVTATGGALVPTTIKSEIQRLLTIYSPIRGLASVLSSSSNMTINMEATGAVATWTAEAGVIGETNPTITNVNFNAYKLATMIKMSNELIHDNVVNIEGYISEKVAQAFAVTESLAFVKGDGNGKPAGFTLATLPASNIITSATTLKVGYADLVAVYNAILPAYQTNASFVVSRDMFAQLMGLVDGQGRPLMFQDIQNGGVYKIFGRPVIVEPNLDAFNAVGKVSMYFGDWKRFYQIVDREGMGIKRSEERYIEQDVTAIVSTKRTDGRVMDVTSMACLKSK